MMGRRAPGENVAHSRYRWDRPPLHDLREESRSSNQGPLAELADAELVSRWRTERSAPGSRSRGRRLAV